MIKRILVPLDGSEFSRNATKHACDLAKCSDAEVIGLTVLDLLGATGQIAPIHAVALKAYHERIKEVKIDALKRIRYAMGHFREMCENARVRHSEHELQGIPSNCILNAAGYCDLVVMGLRTFFHGPGKQDLGSPLISMLERSVTPILAVPKHINAVPKTVLIAYDGSHQATRALHAVANLNLIRPFKHAYLVTSNDYEMHRSFLLKQAAAYLRSHELSDLTLVDTDKDILTVVHEDYIEKVDLVALGVHASRPFKDFFVGSLAKSLIDYDHMPLLLAQ